MIPRGPIRRALLGDWRPARCGRTYRGRAQYGWFAYHGRPPDPPDDDVVLRYGPAARLYAWVDCVRHARRAAR